jgi:phage terminase large subunit GpA-like protein
MDAFSDPSVERVVVMSSAQIGKTEIANCVIGFYIDHDPSPMLVVEPTIDVGKSWSKDRLSPMIRDTPCLTRKVADVKSRSTSNVQLHKQFYGGHITIAGANSAASLRARPIRIVLCDDIDAFPASAGTEGDPVSLAVKRTTTFWNRKIGLFSTPTDEGISKIEAEYIKSDRRKYHVPCAHCGEFQVFTFDNVKWPKSEPSKAQYECPFCKGTITDNDKARMVLHGEWRKESPEVKRIAGFWINELYSPWVSFGQIAEKFYASKDDPQTLKVWTNTSLGESWKQVVVSRTSDNLFKARCALKPQTVPAEAVALTCGIDQQMAGYWFVVRAWAANMTSWLIHYGFLPTEEDLDTLVFNTQYPVEGSDRSMSIWRAARDTGGTKGKEQDTSMTEAAYWWIVKNQGRGPALFGTKGASANQATRFKVGEPLMQTPSGKALPQWFRIITIDTDVMKDYFHYGLDQAISQGPNALYLHAETGEDYIKQITAEEKRINRRGVAEWVKLRRDNHILDGEILAISLAQPQWVGGGVNLLRRPAVAGSSGAVRPMKRRVISQGVM